MQYVLYENPDSCDSDILFSMAKVDILPQGRIFDTLASDWDSLYLTSDLSTPFQSRDWIQNWAEFYDRSSDLVTIVAREGNEVVGIFPLVRSIGPWRAIRPAGVGPSDYLPPLVLPGQSSVLAEIANAVRDLQKTALVDLHQQPSDHEFTSLWGDIHVDTSFEQATCLILDLPPTFEAYVSSLSKSLRYDVRRLGGKALKEKGAEIRWATAESIDQFATDFFELHRLRWKSRGLPGAFFGKGEAFQRSWMHKAIQSGTLIMNSLVVDGKTVGSVYAMRSGKTVYFYQAGMDPAASSLSPGTILVSRMIEHAIEEGAEVFDFMRGDEPYKRRWKPTRERKNMRILLPKANVLGKAGLWWNTTAWQVELKVRDRIEGKSLKPTKSQSTRA